MLPIQKTPVDGQVKDIEEQILSLVMKYMENPENIILAIQVHKNINHNLKLSQSMHGSGQHSRHWCLSSS